MMPVAIGFDPATSLNAPCPAPKGCGMAPGSFHTMLRDAAAARAEARTDTAAAHGEDAVSGTGREAAGAARAEAPADTAAAHGEDAMSGTGRDAAGDDGDTRPTRRSVADDGEGQLVWALLAQILQKLTSGADTNPVAAESQDNAAASDPEAADADEQLAALVDLLKQLQESPTALTAESAIPLDRLRQMLEQWQAGATESQPEGLPGRLLHLLKSLQAALPGIAGNQETAAMASQDGAAEQVPLETVRTAGAGPSPAAGSQPDGRLIDAGRAARGTPRDAKDTKVTAGQTDAAVRADEPSDRRQPAADERGPGAGRLMPETSPAASPPTETHRSTAMPSKAQASEGSFALPKNFEAAADTQSELSDDSGLPAGKALAGLVLSTADKGAGEGGSPDLRFEATLRDVRSFAVPDGSPDKPAETAAAVKGRDAAAATVKTDVFDQIVQRAAVHVKNDQGEIRIDLKPDVLGHVRMQIVTDNQQVTVRILTELPMVRDMIESNIHQLKSDLQQQGLQVERIEVAVADDPRQHPGRQGRTGAGWKGHATGDVAPAAAESSAGLRPEAAYRWGLGGQTTINMFA